MRTTRALWRQPANHAATDNGLACANAEQVVGMQMEAYQGQEHNQLKRKEEPSQRLQSKGKQKRRGNAPAYVVDTGPPVESFGQPKEGKKRAKGDFRGVKLNNKTHRLKTDPAALLAQKSHAHPAQPSYRGHVLMDNRHALIVDC